MQKKLKKFFNKIKSVKSSRFDLILFVLVIVMNAILVGLSIWQGTYNFNTVFLQASVPQILIIVTACSTVFYLTFKSLTKKAPGLFITILYFILLALFLFNLSGINFLAESLLRKSSFSVGNAMFVSFTLLLLGLMFSRYDFPITEDAKKLYLAIIAHFRKSFSIFLFLFFIISLVGLLDGIWVYSITILPFILNMYLFKAILANLRK